MTAVRFGFLGAGFVASKAVGPAVHAAEGARLHSVAANDFRRARALSPDAGVHQDYAEILEDDRVDVVYISLPNSLHLPWIERALAAGKHVLCEKPLCLSYQEAAHVFDVAVRHGRLLVEAMWYRWHPRTKRAEAVIRRGDLGPVHALKANFSFSGVPHGNYRMRPELGGGALLDVGCYALSAARWAMPAIPHVASAAFEVGDAGVDLSTTARLEASDATGAIGVSIAGPPAQELVVTGSGGSLTFGPPAFTAWRAPTSLQIGGLDQIVSEPFGSIDPYQLMIEAVVARVRGEPAWVVEPAESLGVALLTDAVRQRALESSPTHA